MSFVVQVAILSLLIGSSEARRLLPDDPTLVQNSPTHRRTASSVTVDVPTNPDDHLVESLPLLEDGAFTTPHWAGLLPASDNGHKYLFYWLFAPDIPADSSVDEADIPLIIWLNGGPGCSSMDGLFLENGPLSLKEVNGTWSISASEYSWHTTPAYVVYLDQPVGTGLAFTTANDHPRNDEEVNRDFYHWLLQFLQLHSDKFLDNDTMKRPLYFSGESHAGHYIPSMMNHILQQNDAGADLQVPLSGAAIGNGWIDPYHQYAAAAAAYGHGLIGKSQVNALDEQERQCQAQLERGNYRSSTCFGLLDNVIAQSQGTKGAFKVSQYDIRVWESKSRPRDFPPGHKDVESYLGKAPVQAGQSQLPSGTTEAALQALHATASWDSGQRYRECTDPPYNALAHQDGMGVVDDVVAVLDHASKPTLLFFNGIMDLICNHVGNEVALEELPWSHHDDWITAERFAWKVQHTEPGDNSVSGYAKIYENLIFLKLMDSGHMAPMDIPDVALDMMRVLVTEGRDFAMSKQNLAMSDGSNNNDEPADCPVCPPPTTCPACPQVKECPEPAPATDTPANKDTTSKDTKNDNGNPKFTIVHAGILALLGLGCFLGFLSGRRRSRAQRVAPSYLELRASTYRDENGYDDDESEGEVRENGNASKFREV